MNYVKRKKKKINNCIETWRHNMSDYYVTLHQIALV
jgi:hypothetical protein